MAVIAGVVTESAPGKRRVVAGMSLRLMAGALLLACIPGYLSAQEEFFLKDGDTVVFYGRVALVDAEGLGDVAHEGAGGVGEGIPIGDGGGRRGADGGQGVDKQNLAEGMGVT